MTGRLVLVTTELHPETRGGAGVVVDSLARRLGPERGAMVVLCAPEPVDAVERPGAQVVVASIPAEGFLARSQAVAGAVSGVVQQGDRVEVQDFEGLGFWMLSHRRELGLESVPITVRFHGPYDLLAKAMDTPPHDWDLPREMERGCFEMADAVLVPAPGHLPVLKERYGIPDERLVVAPPPIPDLAGQVQPTASPVTVAVVGRLGEMKGSQDLVEAVVRLRNRGLDVRARFVGGDGWSTTASAPMSEWLTSLIPDRHREAISFMGPVERSEVPAALSGVTAVVVPSRFESFCLAAHEARRLGLPVLVPDLDAFRGMFSETTGALVYDGSVDGLTGALMRLAEVPGLSQELAHRPAPDPGDPWAAYGSDPAPRHLRAQAGLATAAVKRVEALTAVRDPKGAAILRRLFRALPAGLSWRAAREAAKRAPEPLAQWVSDVGWPEEKSRRDRTSRIQALESAIAERDHTRLPGATIVIPVHDDGAFLLDAIVSVYEQTHPSWEIVVVDDGSTDRATIDLVRKLERPWLRVIRQENQGLPAARNAGMEIARGRFVVPLDADDELHPEFLSRLIPALEAEPDAAFAHCHARLFGDIDTVWVTRPFNPYWQLLGNGVVGCVLLRTEAWKAVGGYDETMTYGNEDWELWLRLQEAGWGQVQVPLPLFRYRKHGVSMSVRTEARFEEGRREVRDRHPALYSASFLVDLKHRWYPRLTVIAEPGTPVPDDAEVVHTFGDLESTWGKYVVDLRGATGITPGLLDRMATALENSPGMAGARTTGYPPVGMLRRWNLHDREADPEGEMVVDDPATGHVLEPGSVPRPGWSVPPEARAERLPVQRQRPEESGYLPDPETW